MSGGHPGWPPAGGPSNPWPQQGGAWGPAAAPGPQASTPFRTPATPPSAVEIDEVELPWPVNSVPNACACCSGAATTSLQTQASAQVGRTTQTRSLAVPYCARCADHIRHGARRGRNLGFLAFAVAMPVPFALMSVWDHVPWWIAIPSALAASLGALAMLDALWQSTPISRDQGCHEGEQPAFWMHSFAFNGPSVKFRGVNPRWLENLGRMYGAQPHKIGPRKAGRARWIAVPLTASILAIPLWFAMHGHVYFDNPGATPLTFDIDNGGRTITIAPGEHDDVWLPSGARQIVVRSGSNALETINGEVGHWSKHAVTPLGTHCYAVTTRAYGNAYASGGYEPAPPGQRWHDLRRVAHVFEPFPRSVSVGRGQRGATRRRFGRVTCSRRISW